MAEKNESRHHCIKCGAFRYESEMNRKGYHPSGMRWNWMNYHYYCKKCPTTNQEETTKEK